MHEHSNSIPMINLELGGSNMMWGHLIREGLRKGSTPELSKL